MLRINIGQLALMPDATTDQVLDFASFVADMLPDAAVKVVLNGRKHQVSADSDPEALAVLVQLSQWVEDWNAGVRRMARTAALAARSGDCRALYHDTTPCPPPEECS
jgi:hypothetical protein